MLRTDLYAQRLGLLISDLKGRQQTNKGQGGGGGGGVKEAAGWAVVRAAAVRVAGAQGIAQNLRAAKLIKQRCPLTKTSFSGCARGTVKGRL